MSSGNHRAYQPIKPAASRMLAKRWDDSSYGLHRKKLRNAKPTVDTRAPKTYMHLQLKLKKLQMEEERLATVERDNRILLEKMSHIMRTRGRVDNRNDYDHKSLNKTKRQQELLRITHENQAILKRITAKQPFYDRSAWAREYDKARQYQGQISRFPQGEETGASSSTSRATKGKRRGKRDTTPPPPRESILTKEDVVAAVAPGAAEQKALKMINDRAFLEDLWNQCDFNGNGGCSLAEIDKMVVERGWNLSKPTLLRAYKKTTLKDGDQDAWVERDEFAALIRNMFLFENLWSLFDDLDTEDDRRVNFDEFRLGMAKIGSRMSEEDAKKEFAKADKNGGGQILFKEFCNYIASVLGFDIEADDAKWKDSSKKKKAGGKKSEHDTNADVSTEKFDELETKLMADLKAGKAGDFWKEIDFNNNKIVSLAEIDKWVVERYPLLNSKPALMRAYKKTLAKDGDDDDFVREEEFASLLRNIFYFNKLFVAFDGIDTDNDRRIDLSEFKRGLSHFGLSLSDDEAQKEFDAMDSNDGGVVLFDEFAAWAAAKKMPVD
ncbi:hypothetical protein PTSG_06715 [Salpingoeca rosetta]|uniref:EF-hand domain-containing protein n=1 Tax=Salpingoeca rosetta (strain ATCC 50818 / BSB-021) TaxID=946362 RepID=F2UEK7_SALR5|nr:uncharacterized protein PTSG_06715 [Salpingoeca rosetta]EGD75057.1 hypothetical protein PTSG_06715 [Salpingoeca rosetta]|eukprot:XP_004992110.1 hypothetical protein PTSG_06715 [Salpingoeca rosetta]